MGLDRPRPGGRARDRETRDLARYHRRDGSGRGCLGRAVAYSTATQPRQEKGPARESPDRANTAPG